MLTLPVARRREGERGRDNGTAMLKLKLIKLGRQIYRRLVKRVLERGRLAMSKVRVIGESPDPPQDEAKPPRE